MTLSKASCISTLGRECWRAYVVTAVLAEDGLFLVSRKSKFGFPSKEGSQGRKSRVVRFLCAGVGFSTAGKGSSLSV